MSHLLLRGRVLVFKEVFSHSSYLNSQSFTSVSSFLGNVPVRGLSFLALTFGRFVSLDLGFSFNLSDNLSLILSRLRFWWTLL